MLRHLPLSLLPRLTARLARYAGLAFALQERLARGSELFAFMPEKVDWAAVTALDSSRILGPFPDRSYELECHTFISNFVHSRRGACALFRIAPERASADPPRRVLTEELIVFDFEQTSIGKPKKEGWSILDMTTAPGVGPKDLFDCDGWRWDILGILSFLPEECVRCRPVHNGNAALRSQLISRAEYVLFWAYDREMVVFARTPLGNSPASSSSENSTSAGGSGRGVP